MQIAHTLARGAGAPVRLGFAAGELGLSVVRSVVGEARRLVGGRPSYADGWRRPHPPRVWSPGPEVRDRGESATADRAPAAPAPGPGPEVHVDPPWDGYDKLTAAQIADRLVAADRELAAAVALYEGLGRKRVSVTRAADRRLRSFGA